MTGNIGSFPREAIGVSWVRSKILMRVLSGESVALVMCNMPVALNRECLCVYMCAYMYVCVCVCVKRTGWQERGP